jgi:hypothetical protein
MHLPKTRLILYKWPTLIKETVMKKLIVGLLLLNASAWANCPATLYLDVEKMSREEKEELKIRFDVNHIHQVEIQAKTLKKIKRKGYQVVSDRSQADLVLKPFVLDHTIYIMNEAHSFFSLESEKLNVKMESEKQIKSSTFFYPLVTTEKMTKFMNKHIRRALPKCKNL